MTLRFARVTVLAARLLLAGMAPLSFYSMGCSFFSSSESPARSGAAPQGSLQVALDYFPDANPSMPLRQIEITLGDSGEVQRFTDSLPRAWQKTWSDLPPGTPYSLQARAYRGQEWVYAARANGRMPTRGDTAIDMIWHPVYDGVYASRDSLPRLHGLRLQSLRLTQNDSQAKPFLHLRGGEIIDLAAGLRNPAAIDLVFRRDTLHSALRGDTLALPGLPNEGTGKGQLRRLNAETRMAYRQWTSTPALQAEWDEDFSRSAVPVDLGAWILVRDEDNIYLLHITGISSAHGWVDFDFYSHDESLIQ